MLFLSILGIEGGKESGMMKTGMLFEKYINLTSWCYSIFSISNFIIHFIYLFFVVTVRMSGMKNIQMQSTIKNHQKEAMKNHIIIPVIPALKEKVKTILTFYNIFYQIKIK